MNETRTDGVAGKTTGSEQAANPKHELAAGHASMMGSMAARVGPAALQRKIQQRAAGRGAVQRKANAEPGGDDNFKVDQGQLTFDAEGSEGGKYHTRTAHWPGGASGVTIGRGYDLGAHKAEAIKADMTAAGVAPADAGKYAGAAGLKGKDAKAWLDKNKDTLPEITPEQQKALFETTYEEHRADVERISGNYAETKAKETGKDASEFEINFDTLHPAIKDTLVDLRYRGDYTPATRKFVQPLAIANDLAGLTAVMGDKSKWSTVPEDRFQRRKTYLEAALAKEAKAGGTQPQGGGTTDKSNAGGAAAKGSAGGATNAPSQQKPASGKPIGTATLKANVNVRKSASKTGDILETAKAGTKFDVLANSGSWYQVSYKGGTAYVTTIAEYVEFTAAPAPKVEEKKQQAPAQGGAGGGSWLDDMWDAATHLVDSVISWWEGDPEDQKQSEGDGKAKGGDAGGVKAGAGAATGNVTENKESGQTGGGTTGATTGGAPGSYLFKDAFQIVDADARLRDSKMKATGKTIAQGTKVFVVKAEKTYVQIATVPGATETIGEADNVWTAFSNLGGTGSDVGLGNEDTDAADKKKADELRAGLPPGRNPGKSPYKWAFSGYFQPSLEGKALQSSLMSKVQSLMEWAVQNDMITSDIIIGDGVRGPKTAHKMCVSWNIQYRWGSVITLDALKKLPGGKDADGTQWYQDGWGEDQVKANALAIRSSSKIAAAGYEYGDNDRLPLPLNSKPGVSRHCTGRAVDVTIPWRAPAKDAATGATDVWAWEDIYKQFGLHRPLHKNLQSDVNLQENWHIEETGKKLDGNDEVEKVDG